MEIIINKEEIQQIVAEDVKSFICKSCNHELPIEFNVRTENFCYLCDPNITLEECLSEEPLERFPKVNN